MITGKIQLFRHRKTAIDIVTSRHLFYPFDGAAGKHFAGVTAFERNYSFDEFVCSTKKLFCLIGLDRFRICVLSLNCTSFPVECFTTDETRFQLYNKMLL